MFEGEAAATPVALALGEVNASFDRLLKQVEDGGLDHFDAHHVVTFLQEFESFRNRLSLVDHRALRHCEDHQIHEVFNQGRLRDFLAATLRVSGAEASRRVRAMAAVGERKSMLGETLEPRRPHLAAAQRRGLVSPEQVSIIESALGSVDMRGFHPAAIETGEVLLTQFAVTFGPKDLRLLANQVVERIDTDGTRPREELNEARRHFTMRLRDDGSYSGEFRLTGATGAKLEAVLAPLAAPRTTTVPDDSGALKPEADQRPYGQRMHDALDEACSRLLRSGSLPDSGGTPASVIVRIDAADLLSQTGFGETSGGTQLSAAEMLKVAAEAEILPAVLATSGAVLSLGRSRRIATPAQTHALFARDLGCSFPGCTHAAEWCERHHIRPWVLGGKTDLSNLTLLCGYHHRHFLDRGWSVRVGLMGVPEWIPPRYVDRQQRPLVNARIRRRLEEEHLLRPPGEDPAVAPPDPPDSH